MGLFDKLLGRSSDSKPKNELKVHSTNRETSPSVISRAIAERECGLSKAIRIPFTEAALTGGSLMQLAPTLKALVAGTQAAMKEAGVNSYRTSGDPQSGWIVVDYVDVVVHVFSPEARAYYALEKLWETAQPL